MLIFAGMEADKADERAAKLKKLQEYFRESDPHALSMLGNNDLSKTNAGRGDKLVINSHGNVNSFAGMTADALLTQLKAKGLEKGSFPAIYLMACQVGAQAQDNSIIDNFAKDFFRALTGGDMQTKVYAPRGTLSYQVKQQQNLGQKYLVVERMYIKSPEKDYELAEGIALVMM